MSPFLFCFYPTVISKDGGIIPRLSFFYIDGLHLKRLQDSAGQLEDAGILLLLLPVRLLTPHRLAAGAKFSKTVTLSLLDKNVESVFYRIMFWSDNDIDIYTVFTDSLF